MDQPGPRLAIREHCVVLHVHEGQQRGRALTFIVISYALHIPETQWQHRLRTLKGLALNRYFAPGARSISGGKLARFSAKYCTRRSPYALAYIAAQGSAYASFRAFPECDTE